MISLIFTDGNLVKQFLKECPNQKPMTPSMVFAEKTSLIFQFQTGNARVNGHFNRINPQHTPLCRHCSHPYETTDHFLFKCPVLSETREKSLQQSPTVANSRYGTLEQLQWTCTFIRMALGCQE
ncbi:hypothetical protein BsWGS_15334 [Bradybaena similaris]